MKPALLIALLCAATVRAEEELTARLLLSKDPLPAGCGFRIAVVVELARPWHINANPAGEGLIPTTLALRAPETVIVEHIDYPKGKTAKLAWAERPIPLYEDRVVILARARVKDTAAPGPLRIEAVLRYQACDEQVCLPPKQLKLLAETEIAPAGYSPAALHPEIFGGEPVTATANPLPVSAAAPNRIEELLRHRGWTAALVFVFLGGLALNLTPCVYPMIAITVSYFGGRGSESRARAFAAAAVYFVGIVLTYSTLGLAAAMTGGLFGALLQSTAVLVGIAALLVALALSMFGVFEIRPPRFLMEKASGLSSKAGWVGVFFLGATVGVIAAPCIAPVLVALLVFVGQTGNPWVGWWMFFTLACGLGLPYVVLGTFSGLLSRLPKSGLWMVWVKRVFGVALLAVAAWITNPLWRPHRASGEAGIAWKPYDPAALQQAAADNRPVIIDFYADWCIPCKEMDKHTFSDPRVVEKSREFLMLKADLTRTGSPDVEKLLRQYRIFGVPTTIFLAPDGTELAELRQVGFVPAREFLDVMERALSARAAEPAPRRTKSPAEEMPGELMRPF